MFEILNKDSKDVVVLLMLLLICTHLLGHASWQVKVKTTIWLLTFSKIDGDQLV